MKIFLIVIGIIIVLGIVGFIFASMGLSDIKKMVIKDVDISKLPDGVYTGTFHKVRWTYDVEVTIKDHKIADIKSTNKLPDVSQEKVVDGAIKAMKEKQSIDIDVISGATVNTKAFRKAVENALTQGHKE